MKDKSTNRISSSPDIDISGLKIWVNGRQFPNSADYWDNGWLDVDVVCTSKGASVEAAGPIIHLSELSSWANELKDCSSSLGHTMSKAKLDCMERELSIEILCSPSNKITMSVSITADPLAQKHWFQFKLERGDLLSLLDSCERVLTSFPQIQKPVD